MQGIAVGTPEFAVSQAAVQGVWGFHLQLVSEVEASLVGLNP